VERQLAEKARRKWAKCSRSTSAETRSTAAARAERTSQSTTRLCPRCVVAHIACSACLSWTAEVPAALSRVLVYYTPLFGGFNALPYLEGLQHSPMTHPYFLTHTPFYTPHVNGPIQWARGSAAPCPQTKIVLQCVAECVCMPVQHTHMHTCTNAHMHMCTHNKSRALMYTLSLSLSPSFSLLLSLPVSHTHTCTQAFQGRHGRAFLFSNV